MFRATDQDPSLGHFLARKEAETTPAAPLAEAAGEGERLTDAELDGIKKRHAETWSHIAGQRWATEEMAGDAINDNADLLAHVTHLQTESATLRARLAEETRAAAKWRSDLLDALHGWMDTSTPAEHHYETTKGYQVDLAAHEEFFKCKALGYGLAWPLEDAYLPSLPAAALPLVGDRKEGQGEPRKDRAPSLMSDTLRHELGRRGFFTCSGIIGDNDMEYPIEDWAGRKRSMYLYSAGRVAFEEGATLQFASEAELLDHLDGLGWLPMNDSPVPDYYFPSQPQPSAQ